MKKYLFYVLNIVIAVAMVSCSSGDDSTDSGEKPIPPILENITISSQLTRLGETYVEIYATIEGDKILTKGVCYSTSPNPDINDFQIIENTNDGYFYSIIKNLDRGGTYYARCFATTTQGTVYGSEIEFTTYTDIEVKTTTTNVDEHGRLCTWVDLIVHGDSIVSKGIYYSRDENLTIENCDSVITITNPNSLNEDRCQIRLELEQGRQYYLCGFAKNKNNRIKYGKKQQFKTLGEPQIQITTLPVKDITETTAISGGNITDDGGSPLFEKGVCWSLTENPTIDDFKTEDGAEIGVYNSKMSGLSEGVTYYVRSYATNNKGTTYGQQIEFKTIGVIPVLETSEVTSITGNTAKSGGTIIKKGGDVSTVGICWGLTENPTIYDNKNEIPYESDSFELQLSNLESLKKYYVRSYAINDTGVGYGKEQSFKSLHDGTFIIFEDSNFETFCLWNFDSNKDGRISIGEVDKITELDISRKYISTIPEIQYFTSLSILNCSNNQLTSLDVSECTSLTELNCRGNLLTSLDVSECTSLTELNFRGNQLTSLDVSGCTSLTTLIYDSSRPISLNASGCISLTELNCPETSLTYLNVSGCTSLSILNCRGNLLTSLDVSDCTSLTELNCCDNQLTSLDVSDCTSLTKLLFDSSRPISLNASGCISLTELNCPEYSLTYLNVSGCTSLAGVDCSYNQLTSLDVSECTSLKYLYCNNNQLTSLHVNGCSSLAGLVCHANGLTLLDVSECPRLTTLDCLYNYNLRYLYLKFGQKITSLFMNPSITQVIYK